MKPEPNPSPKKSCSTHLYIHIKIFLQGQLYLLYIIAKVSNTRIRVRVTTNHSNYVTHRNYVANQWPMLCYWKYFRPKIGDFFQNTDSFYKIWIITLFFSERRQFLAENWRKSQKIVIITLTPEYFRNPSLCICRTRPIFFKKATAPYPGGTRSHDP
jgi:hypothetical protein